MNPSNKVFVALLAVVVVAFGAYYVTSERADAPTIVESESQIPVATDSVDDFAVAIEADVAATASAIQAFDADIDASVSDIISASDSTNLYDPEQI